MESLNGNYPVQTLYRSCLNCLRINYKIINFKQLNDEIALDMFEVIKNEDHLKLFRLFPYRFIFNESALKSYIYKYYKTKYTHVDDMIGYQPSKYSRKILADKKYTEYISGVLALNSGLLYDIVKDMCYYIYLGLDTHMQFIHEEKVIKLYNEYIHLMTAYDDGTLFEIYSEEYFDQYPGLAEWAESAGYISRKLLVPENVIEKK